MIEGGCLCGGIRFELHEEGIVLFNLCYCSYCQKETGTAYTSQLQVPSSHFKWLKGEDLISDFESTPGNHRRFCSVCGSRVPQSTGKFFAVPAGLLEDDPGIRPEIRMHMASRAHWDTIDESIPSLPDQGSEEFWREFMSSRSNEA